MVWGTGSRECSARCTRVAACPRCLSSRGWLPKVAPVPVAKGPRRIALRDRPYLALTVLDGIMAIQFKVLTVAIPLWLVTHTEAPHWLISGTMLLNTLLVIAFQIRAGRNIDNPSAGATAYRRSGVAFLLACALISMSAGVPSWAAATLLPAAVAVRTIGELWHSAAGFEVSFALAPQHATGQYLGVFGLGAGLAEAVGPALLISLCITIPGELPLRRIHDHAAP